MHCTQMIDTLSEWHQSLPCSVGGRERERSGDRERERKREGGGERDKSSSIQSHNVPLYLPSRNNHAVCNL